MHFILWTKGSHENTNFDIFKCSDENFCQISYVIFETTSQFFFKFCLTLQCHEIYSSVLFYVKSCIICKKGTNQRANISDFLVLGSKFTKFLLFLKQKKSFSSNFAPLFGIMRDISSILFSAEILYTFSKTSQSKYRFGEI